MKKEEIIKELENMGYKPEKDMNYNMLRKELRYRQSLDKENFLSEPTLENDEKFVERQVEKTPDLRTPLEKARAALMPEIKELMKELKGMTSASHDQIRTMFRLYNQYYLRNDNPSCSHCIARVFKALRKLGS